MYHAHNRHNASQDHKASFHGSNLLEVKGTIADTHKNFLPREKADELRGSAAISLRIGQAFAMVELNRLSER